MQRKIIVFAAILLSIVLVSWVLYFFLIKPLWVDVKFNVKDPRAISFSPNELHTEFYVSYRLNAKEKGLWVKDQAGNARLIRPDIISIFLTDKIRFDNGVSQRGGKVFGSAISAENDKIAIIYIWAGDSVYAEKNYEEEIVNYIYDTIVYYQQDQ